MKLVILILSTLALSEPSFALPFYTVRTNNPISSVDLKKECETDLQSAKEKLSSISQRLGLPLETLSVTARYGSVSHRNGSTRFPTYSYEYFCLLNFVSKGPTVEITENTPARFIRLDRSNWETACQPAYQSSLSNPEIAATVLWTAWTVFQGRMCEVSEVSVKKVQGTDSL